MSRRALAALLGLALLCGPSRGLAADAGAAASAIPAALAPWRQDVRIAPVVPDAGGHSIHTYYITTPESPDGRWVLYYASAAADGHTGEIRVLERATGRSRVLAADVVVEDAHRAACQQWVSGGRRVAFHNVLPDGRWVVACVDLATGEQRVLARDRQLGFGQPTADVVPLYSPHWDPGAFRDLELLNVETREVTRPPVTADGVRKAYPDQVAKLFGDRPVSVFFPVLGPDLTRVFFKLATPAGGDFRSKQASVREGLVGYDLRAGAFTFMQTKWGHPAWHPDGRQVLNVGGVVTDAATGKTRRIANVPSLPGSHPSFSPDGRLYASDAAATGFGKPASWWVVGVGDAAAGEFVPVHQFDNSKGARSWRPSHPHPVFSPDGRRLYFNVGQGGRTVLHVAEVPR